MVKENSDEIDVLALLIQIVHYIRSKFWTLVIAGLLGAATLGGLSFTIPNVYVSKLILSSDILTESYSERITESLVNLIKEQNAKGLAERLGISELEAKGLKKIDIESVKETTASEKKEESIFIVTAEVTERSLLPKLQDGIIGFLRNNEFVNIRVRQRANLYTAMIQKIGIEIKSLDSLKKRLFTGQTVYAKSAEMLLIDPTSIYSKILELNQRQIEYKNAIELVDSIQLVEGFTSYEKPAKPNRFMMILIGFFGGVFIGFTTFGIKWVLNKTTL